MISNTSGLSNEQIARVYPSVFAEFPHESRSARYLYIPTYRIIDGLREIGFVPTAVMQAKTRDESRFGFTKHLLRFRSQQDLGNVNPDVFEVMIRNSHDGTSAYDLMSGIFRMVCSNGLIVGDLNNNIKVRHSGHADIVGQVVESTLRLVEDSEGVMDEVEEMKHIELSRPEQLLLAKYAMAARFDLEGEDEDVAPNMSLVPYTPEQFLQPRRRADLSNDLYTTMNRVQENAIKGGIHARDAKGKRHTTREIKGIDQQVKTNKLIWQFAAELKKFKA